MKPVDAGVISVTMVHAGEATNVVPDSCELQGTVRTFSLEVLDLIERRMREMAEHTCAAHGRSAIHFHATTRPPSTAREAAFARRRAFHRRAGQVLAQEPTMGAEDFPTCCRPSRARTASLPTATATTACWATAAGRARCTTPATTSTTH